MDITKTPNCEQKTTTHRFPKLSRPLTEAIVIASSCASMPVTCWTIRIISLRRSIGMRQTWLNIGGSRWLAGFAKLFCCFTPRNLMPRNENGIFNDRRIYCHQIVYFSALVYAMIIIIVATWNIIITNVATWNGEWIGITTSQK